MEASNGEYLKLKDRLAGLTQRRAVLQAEQERQSREREHLSEVLRAGGVNLDDLPGERARLTREIAEIQARSKQAVDDFEAALDGAQNGTPGAAPAAPTTPAPAGDLEID